jgi:chaperonin cofactor prefoldin
MSLDNQLEQIHELMREMREEARGHRKETQAYIVSQTKLQKDVETIKTVISEMEPKVERHDNVYRFGKTAGTVIAAVFTWAGYDAFKNHWPWGRH